MKTYHKIQTVFKRDMENNGKTLLLDQYSRPEFEFLKNNHWVFTEKVDGTNIRVMINDGKISFGGKTDRAQLPVPLFERLHELFSTQEDKLAEMFPSGGCLYGEGYGPKIQKGGGDYGERQDFVLFDAKVGDWWLARDSASEIAGELGIRHVPIIGEGSIEDMVRLVRDGITSEWGNFQAEGIVARPKVELQTRGRERIITKLKTRDFR